RARRGAGPAAPGGLGPGPDCTRHVARAPELDAGARAARDGGAAVLRREDERGGGAPVRPQRGRAARGRPLWLEPGDRAPARTEAWLQQADRLRPGSDAPAVGRTGGSRERRTNSNRGGERTPFSRVCTCALRRRLGDDRIPYPAVRSEERRVGKEW